MKSQNYDIFKRGSNHDILKGVKVGYLTIYTKYGLSVKSGAAKQWSPGQPVVSADLAGGRVRQPWSGTHHQPVGLLPQLLQVQLRGPAHDAASSSDPPVSKVTLFSVCLFLTLRWREKSSQSESYACLHITPWPAQCDM